MKLLFCILLSFLTPAAFSLESSTYDFSWLDKDKQVYVLQNRKFRKSQRVYLNMSAGLTLSGAFVDGQTYQFRGGYFFREDWGFELIYAMNTPEVNSTAKAILAQQSVPFYRKVHGYYGGLLNWSPFYAKMNTFNKIIYFDWILGAGIAKVDDKNNRLAFTNLDDKTQVSESHTSAIWQTYVRFYFTEKWGATVGVTALHYQATSANSEGERKNKYYHHYDFAAGLSYTF